MEKTAEYKDIGKVDYNEAWEYQEKLFQKLLNQKENPSHLHPNHYLIFCQHPHVYTLGKSGAESNLLANSKLLSKINATYVKTNRGGDITYHGPGQLVGYPIFNLDILNLSVKKYIYLLEEVIIKTLDEFNIKGERLEGATGVWLETGDAVKKRKICSIGVRASRKITMHGFAFNINTDLKYFGYINPCGFTNIKMTSLEKETGKTQSFDLVKEKVKTNLFSVFNLKMHET